MIEDELRASFARHEPDAPATSLLRRGIARLTIRRRRRLMALRTSGVAVIVAIVLVAVPLIVRQARTLNVPNVLPGVTSVGVPDRALNILLVGLDDPQLLGTNGGSRADSITLVHVTADRRQVYLIDFERDVEVDVPGHGVDKINAAYAVGGASMLASVVESLSGVSVDGAVIVTLEALGQLTDALGGVHLCLPAPVLSIHTGRQFAVGCHSLNGAAVQDLVRQRMELRLGAYDRVANIHRVLIGLVKKVSVLNLLTDAGRLATLARTDGIVMDFPKIDPFVLAAQLKGLKGDDVIGIVSPHFNPSGINGSSERLDPVVTPKLFAALRADTMHEFVLAQPDWVVGH